MQPTLPSEKRLPGFPRGLGSVLAILILASCSGDDVPESEAVVEEYGAHLSRLPVDAQSSLARSGEGDIVARVEDGALVVSGEFVNLDAAILAVRLHRGAPGLRGEPIADLQSEGSTEGRIRGEVVLEGDLMKALEDHHLYVQVASEGFPEGALRGWLFPGAAR